MTAEAESGCRNCAEIAEVESGRHPWAVARLRAGYVWLNPCQYYAGATFFVSRTCVAEIHQLPHDERQTHLMEMSAVAAAVLEEFGARKMNDEALGNAVPHLHWWLTPRHHDDPRPEGPIWEDPDFLRTLWTQQGRPSPDEALALRRRLLVALERQPVTIEARYV